MTARQKFLEMLREETTKDISEHYSAIDVLSLCAAGEMSTQARHRRLKEYLMNLSDCVQMNRDNARTLFSARHFTAFFGYACEHFARTFKDPFDFIKVSRLRFPVCSTLDQHLLSFLSRVKTTEEVTKFAVPIIASTFFLDNYPPDMHRKPSSLRHRRVKMDLELLITL